MIKFIKKVAQKISNIVRGAAYIIATLLGIHWQGSQGWNTEALIHTGIIFFVGTPVIMLFMGSELFSLALWLAILLSVLILMNLEDALLMTLNFIKYGVLGVISDEKIGVYENDLGSDIFSNRHAHIVSNTEIPFN